MWDTFDNALWKISVCIIKSLKTDSRGVLGTCRGSNGVEPEKMAVELLRGGLKKRPIFIYQLFLFVFFCLFLREEREREREDVVVYCGCLTKKIF